MKKTTRLGIVGIILGITCLAIAARSMCVTYVPSNTLRFNLLCVWPGQFALLAVGMGQIVHGVAHIFAADHKKL